MKLCKIVWISIEKYEFILYSAYFMGRLILKPVFLLRY